MRRTQIHCRGRGRRGATSTVNPTAVAARPSEALQAFIAVERTPEASVPGMMAAAADLVAHLQQPGSRLALYGDYDTDGQTSVEVIRQALSAWDTAPPSWRGEADDGQGMLIGFSKASEGFGLSPAFVQEAVEQGCSALVVVDCGSGSPEAVAAAQRAGLQVWIVDHHKVDSNNPADYHLNPQVQQTEATPNVGAQLSYKFAQATVAALQQQGLPTPDEEEYRRRALWLAGYGCYTDWGHKANDPENNALLHLMKDPLVTPPPGLVELAKLQEEESVWQRRGFTNAFKTMRALNLTKTCSLVDSSTSGKLMATADPQEAYRLAQHLHDVDQQNIQAKHDMLDLGKQQLSTQQQRIGVVVDEDHLPFANTSGRVASSLATEYDRPVIVFSRTSMGATRDQDTFKASTRTNTASEHHHIGDLINDASFQALTNVRWGGHSTVLSGGCTRQQMPQVIAALQTWADAQTDWRHEPPAENE